MADPLRLGGMALGNGLLVHGPTSWSAAVRRADGSIGVAGGRKPRLKGRITDVPGARGVAKLAEAVAVIPLVKRALPEAQLPFGGARRLATMAGASVAAAQVRRRLGGDLGEAGALALGTVPALLALRDGDIAAYHGAEHMTIGAYERGGTVDEVDVTKEHERCGSHLMAPLLASQLAGVALLRRVVGRPSPLQTAAVQLGAVGASVEVFAWSERHDGSRLSKALRAPGHELQRRLGTREPTAEQLEVGRAALDEVLRREGAPA